MNGKVVTRGTNCSPRKGYICLESEGGVVHYRNVKIKELPDSPIADEHVAIANRDYRCLYNGIDFSGWHVGENVTGNWKANDWVFSYDGKAPVGESAIKTVDTFENFGFVFDVRRKENSGVLQISLRDSRGTTINIDPDSEDLKKHLGSGWNRFEGTLVGSILNLSVNGQSAITDRKLEDAPKSGSLRIVPDGPVDFSNVYVRKL